MKQSLNQYQQVLAQLIAYWAKRLKVGPVVIVFDYTFKRWIAYVSIQRGQQFMFVNAKKLRNNGYSQAVVMGILFHEFGHLKRKAFASRYGRVKSEYMAEIQALKWLKQYLPKYAEQYRNTIRHSLQTSHYKGYYRKAFSMIQDYKTN